MGNASGFMVEAKIVHTSESDTTSSRTYATSEARSCVL